MWKGRDWGWHFSKTATLENVTEEKDLAAPSIYKIKQVSHLSIAHPQSTLATQQYQHFSRVSCQPFTVAVQLDVSIICYQRN